MTDPLRRLKFLPWRSLLQVSALTVLIVAALEFLIFLGAKQFNIVYSILLLLFKPPLGLLITFGIAVGIGVLAVYLLERLHRAVILNTASLWALVPCLLLVILLKLLLLPAFLVNLNEMQAIGIIIGIFWKGRPYWR